jgi:hypothetical protein
MTVQPGSAALAVPACVALLIMTTPHHRYYAAARGATSAHPHTEEHPRHQTPPGALNLTPLQVQQPPAGGPSQPPQLLLSRCSAAHSDSVHASGGWQVRRWRGQSSSMQATLQ